MFLDTILKQIELIGKKYKEIEKIILFGSRARKTNHSKSDYDIAVITKNNSFAHKLSFYNDIDEIDSLYKIDVVIVDSSIDTELEKNIKKDGVVILDKENKINNYINAVKRLEEALEECGDHPTSLNRDGVIQRFEFSTELAWKACREYLLDMGYNDINGPKPVMKEAFAYGLVENSEEWIYILNDRNLTSHIYKEQTAIEIFDRIKSQHIIYLLKLAEKFKVLMN
jgi:nucleotidyltransferase substrate binding protein (TIGR01987 family)